MQPQYSKPKNKIITEKIKYFFFGLSEFEIGYNYALDKMKAGRPAEELFEDAIQNINYNDFDRGMVEATRIDRNKKIQS